MTQEQVRERLLRLHECVEGIFKPYKKELQVFAMRSYDYFERKDRR